VGDADRGDDRPQRRAQQYMRDFVVLTWRIDRVGGATTRDRSRVIDDRIHETLTLRAARLHSLDN